LLVAVYGLFALAASSRSVVQIATQFSEAPLRGDATSRRVATVAISIELVGVLVVGLASELSKDAFPHATVWTGFGSGYGFVPLVLPFVGLWWLRHTR
jgi:hypothetical protein